jgi:hypothetical protein
MKRLLLHSFFILFLLIILSFCSVQAEKGDVNKDGQISTGDITYLLEMSTGKKDSNLSFDLNEDGIISSRDAYCIFSLINTTDPLLEELQTVISRYNIGNYFSNERMNWKIIKSDGTKLSIAVIVENGDIVEFREGRVTNPSVKAFTTEQVIRNLLKSQHPKAIQKAWDDGDIRIEGVGIGNVIRIGFMGFVNWVTSPFS